jgi:hypothetical protein
MRGTLISFLPLLACPLGMAAMAGIPAVIGWTKRRNGGRSATDLDAPVLRASEPWAAGRSHEAEAA